MKIEVLVSTMNKNKYELENKMNIKSDAVIINQTDDDSYKEYDIEGKKIKFISMNEIGLSKSRNRAIENASGDICIIADDDVVYNEEYISTIRKEYEKFKEADIIAFDVPSKNISRPTTINKEGYIGYLKSMKISSFQITFKREKILEKNIKFLENFGAGAEHSMGEENIFLFSCISKGMKIAYSNKKIGIVNHEESTWFKGYNKKYFEDLGAVYYAMSSKLSYVFILQFAIRKHKLYREYISFFKALRYMLEGRKEYLKSRSYNK